MNTQKERAQYIVELYQKLNPEKKITSNTEIKNTTIWRLCEYNGAPFQRIKSWCEKKVGELEKTKIINEDMKLTEEQFENCKKLMNSRNQKYGDSWKRLRLNSIIDLMIMKLDRCQKQELDDHAIEVELEDVVNYGVFGLTKIRNEKK